MKSLTILHASDLHFGEPFDPGALEALQSFRAELSPELVVLSGDFTQRAKVQEYKAAAAFLETLEGVPVVVTPGNHDVPLYRILERIFRPLGNYREHISPELDTVTRIPGATVVALNSTAPHTAIVNGKISDGQLRFAREAFREPPTDPIRILVTHHNLIPGPDYEPQQVLPGFQRVLGALGGMGVELVLGGHLHRSFVARSLDAFPQAPGTPSILLAHSGTTTSNRGRGRERGGNSLNVVRVGEKEISIAPHRLLGGAFVVESVHTFPRRREESP